MKFFQDIHSLNDVIRKVKNNQNQVLAGLGIVILLVGGFYGYSYYKKSREEGAYRALTVALEYFNAEVKPTTDADANDLSFLEKKEFRSETEKWEKVAAVFQESYQAHSCSGIASIFLAYRSDALAQLGKTKEALDALKQAVPQIGNKKLKDYFSVKLALLMIDSSEQSDRDNGVSMLTKMAGDEQGVVHDLALYHLGEYFWFNKKFQEAKNYWNQLLLRYGSNDENPSPWVSLAKEKLRLIDADVM